MSRSIQEVVNAHIGDGVVRRGAMIRALQEREDAMADALRLAGVQFGLMPEIVAKVLMDVGVGTPPTPEMREYVNQQFAAFMERLRNENQ